MGEFPLVKVEEYNAGAIGAPLTRSQLQQRIDARESSLLYVPEAKYDLGWL